jgi:TPR repeat protein
MYRVSSQCLAALLAAAVSMQGLAQGADTLPALPDDDALDTALQHQEHGHPWQAEAVLRRLAESGNVTAMERLALMHWYGRTLYPGEAWSRELAGLWFARAAHRGSEVGRHMVRALQRSQAAQARP